MVAVGTGLTDQGVRIETAEACDPWEGEADRLGHQPVSAAYSGGRMHEC